MTPSTLNALTSSCADDGRDSTTTPDWEVSCMCGVTHDDGEAMAECAVCSKWSHLSCHGFKSDSEVPENFVCLQCEGFGESQSQSQDATPTPSTDGAAPSPAAISSAPSVSPLPETDEDRDDRKKHARLLRQAGTAKYRAEMEPAWKKLCRTHEEENCNDLSVDAMMTPKQPIRHYKHDPHTPPHKIGELVFVEPDMNPGFNCQGGLGRVVQFMHCWDESVCQVKYEIGDRVENNVPLRRITSMDGHGVVERLTRSMVTSYVAPETTAAGKPRPPPLDELWDSQKRFSAGWLRDKFDFYPDGVPKGNNKQKKGSKYPSEEHAQQFLRDADSMAMCQRGTDSNPLPMEGTGFPLVFSSAFASSKHMPTFLHRSHAPPPPN